MVSQIYICDELYDYYFEKLSHYLDLQDLFFITLVEMGLHCNVTFRDKVFPKY